MQLRLPTPDAFFAETLSVHGWRRLLPFVWHDDAQTLERVEELADGHVVRLRLRSEQNSVVIDVEGEGDEVDITARVRRMLQMNVPLAALILRTVAAFSAAPACSPSCSASWTTG